MNWFKKKKKFIDEYQEPEIFKEITENMLKDATQKMCEDYYKVVPRGNSVYPYGLSKQWELGEDR